MESSLRNLDLSDLGDTVGATPSEKMVESVADFGIVQPILVAEAANEDGEIHLQVIDGNRRVAASRKARLQYVPAIVLSGLEPEHIAQWTLMANGFRTSNYLTEFWAMKQLQRGRYSPADVRKIAGMAESSFELRSLLSGLNRDIFIGFRNGEISQTVAMGVAKLPPEGQQTLADQFQRTGVIRQADIKKLADSENSQKSEPSEDALDQQLLTAANTALDLGVSKEDFLSFAAKQWDVAEGINPD